MFSCVASMDKLSDFTPMSSSDFTRRMDSIGLSWIMSAFKQDSQVKLFLKDVAKTYEAVQSTLSKIGKQNYSLVGSSIDLVDACSVGPTFTFVCGVRMTDKGRSSNLTSDDFSRFFNLDYSDNLLFLRNAVLVTKRSLAAYRDFYFRVVNRNKTHPLGKLYLKVELSNRKKKRDSFFF